MFLELPLEITLKIFSHLEFEHKLNLKLACRKLNGLITEAVLYENLNLLHPKYSEDTDYEEEGEYIDRFDAIVRKLMKSKVDGSLVKTLHLNIDRLSETLFSQLSDIFPNVKRVIISSDKATTYSRKYNIPYHFRGRTSPVTKWRNTIEKIVSFYDWPELIIDVFYSNYPRLTELDLNCKPSNLMGFIEENPHSLYDNAPLLTKLTLRDLTIDLDILEELHEGFPLLQSLRLFKPKIAIKEDDALPPSIQPASAVTYLALFDSIGFNKNSVALSYIHAKYPYLQQLLFSVSPEHDYILRTAEEYTRRFLIGRKRYLHVVMPVERALCSTYNTIEANFFSNLPESLTTLSIDIHNIDNAVTALAGSNAKIKILDLLDCGEIKSSKQFNPERDVRRKWRDPSMLEHFKKLTSLKMLKIVVDSSLSTYNQEYISSTVTRLYIALDGKYFCIDWILSNFPSLEELHINPSRCDSMKLPRCNLREQTEESDSKAIRSTKTYPHLRSLNIRECFIRQEFLNFIKVAAPHLDELNWTIACYPLVFDGIVDTYDLSHWNLKKCNLHLCHGWSMKNIYCNVTIQNVSKYFGLNCEKNYLIPVEEHYNDSLGRLWFEIVLDQIEQLKIFGFQITKIGEKMVIEL